jgi:hypothetical protein
MKILCCETLGVLLLAMTMECSTAMADDRIGGMQLLPGYKHQPLQGFDSVVGKISKPNGLEISYEIGAIPKPGGLSLGGQFSDRPRLTPQDQRRWYQEQTVAGQKVHLVYRNDNYLLVSFPKQGMNLSVKVLTPDEMAEALLMILTYPMAEKGEGKESK